MIKKLNFIHQKLQSRKTASKYRSIIAFDSDSKSTTKRKNDRTFLDFSSNDYLGLSKHPKLIKAAQQAAERYGAGSTASRLVTGNYPLYDQVEQKLAAFTGRESAVVFNSGFQANGSILPALTDRNTLILMDKLCHNSLLQGAVASRADMVRFRHNDVAHLEELLRSRTVDYQRAIIVTETIFSMDGDCAPVDEIAQLAGKHEVLLYVDEAHSIGHFGEQGSGIARDISNIDILLGTFGKSFGSFGAFVACSQQMKEYLVNFCPGLIYTTGLPPAVLGAIDAALELMPTLDNRREQLFRNVDRVKQELTALGYDLGPTDSQIIPVIIGGEEETLQLSHNLEEAGIIATAIRPPTVPENSSRIRLTISSEHTEEEIDHLINAFANYA